MKLWHRHRAALAASVLLLAVAACTQKESDVTPTAASSEIRVATWNIRYFPEPETDPARVADILAGLDAELIAVQEIRDEAALASLLADVNARVRSAAGTGGGRVYSYVLAESGGNGGLYVGYVYDTLAVELSSVRTMWRLQMTEDLRPGLAARVKSRRGGLDFGVIVMHTDSGVRDRDYQNRLRFLDSLSAVLPEFVASDADVIVLGDLNTMGREADGEVTAVTAQQEIASLDRELEALGMRRLQNEPDCTEYYRGRGVTLDHIVVAAATREAPTDLVAEVLGYCREVKCAPLDPDDMPLDYRVASDHCPVIVDLIDVDAD